MLMPHLDVFLFTPGVKLFIWCLSAMSADNQRLWTRSGILRNKLLVTCLLDSFGSRGRTLVCGFLMDLFCFLPQLCTGGEDGWSTTKNSELNLFVFHETFLFQDHGHLRAIGKSCISTLNIGLMMNLTTLEWSHWNSLTNTVTALSAVAIQSCRVVRPDDSSLYEATSPLLKNIYPTKECAKNFTTLLGII